MTKPSIPIDPSKFDAVVDGTVSTRCDGCGVSIAVDDPTAVWEQQTERVVANALGGIDYLRGEGPPLPRSTHVVRGPSYVWCGECAKGGMGK